MVVCCWVNLPLIESQVCYFSFSNSSRHDSEKLRRGSIALAVIIGRRSANVVFCSGYDREMRCVGNSVADLSLRAFINEFVMDCRPAALVVEEYLRPELGTLTEP